MAFEQLFNGNNSNKNFTITNFDFIRSTHLKAEIGGSPTTDFTVAGKVVSFTTAPATGVDNVKIYRNTPTDAAIHNYTAGGSLKSSDLNENQKQSLYAIEEGNAATLLTGTFTTGEKEDIHVVSNSNWQIRDNKVTTDHLQNDSVTSDKLKDSGSTDSDRAVTTNHIRDLNITTAKIAADAIDGTKIADDSIDSEHYAAGSIDSEHLAANIITESMLQSNSVSLAKLTSSLLTSIQTTYSNPVGTVIWVVSYNPPPGYLKCNGESINNGNTTFPLVGSPDGTNNWKDNTNTVIGTINTAALYAHIGDKLPDLRGEFIRGAAYGRSGIDGTGTTIHNSTAGTYPSHISEGSVLRTQSDDFKNHHHEFGSDDQVRSQGGYTSLGNDFAYDANSDTDGGGQRARTKNDTTNYGGDETRPRNIALLACIKY